MSEGASQLLASIPQLVKDRDAAALVALRDHDDKQIRKAVRKALHTLKSRGVEIPETSPKVWNTGGSLHALRGDLTPLATVDVTSTPGVLKFAISEPQAEDGALLLTGALGADDRVLDFGAFRQTDGQRGRMIRDWQKNQGDRQIDVGWLKGRVLWAREQCMAHGESVPRSLNETIAQLGATPSERPSTFLTEDAFGDAPGLDPASLDETLGELGVPSWPPLVDLESMLEKAAQIHGDKPQPTEESERLELLRQSVEGNETVREGLSTTLASTFDDTAIGLWLNGEMALGRAAFQIASALRGAAAAETIEWVPRLLGYQVASLLRMVGGPDAVRKAMAEEQAKQGKKGGQHEHVHGPDCDH